MKSPWNYLLISTKATTDAGNDRTDNVIENWTISDSSLFTNPQWTGFSQSSWEESLYLEFRVCHIVVYKPKSRTLALQKKTLNTHLWVLKNMNCDLFYYSQQFIRILWRIILQMDTVHPKWGVMVLNTPQRAKES